VPVDERLRIEVRQDQDMVILRLEGELDLAGAPLVERELEGAEIDASPIVVLDLRELQFIDSAGLRVIFSADARARGRGQQFAVTRGSEQVQRVIAITHLGEHLQIIDSPEDARG
jgi:anti-anti-sigma factor